MMLEATQSLYAKSWAGSMGTFAIEIKVGSHHRQLDLHDKDFVAIGRQAVDMVEQAMMTQVSSRDPERIAGKEVERQAFIALFPEPIYVEEIPNEYGGNGWAEKMSPWFLVTTRVGRFKVGWRRRVINLDWSQTQDTGEADFLFPDENVTKDRKSIHAYSYEDAKRYIAKILESSNYGKVWTA